MVIEILAASPIDSDLRRYCVEGGLDAFADSSTWADDERRVRPDTAGWHFIDIPRGAPKSDIAKYCPPSIGCVTTAIADQLSVLRRPGASAKQRADALRYVIHFVGDLHQPLHATTNDDRGGNCVPVAFFGHLPEETDPVNKDYRPSLHGIWDTDIIEHFAHGETPEQIALETKFKAQIPFWESEHVDLSSWAWESHQAAEDTTYGDLPAKIVVRDGEKGSRFGRSWTEQASQAYSFASADEHSLAASGDWEPWAGGGRYSILVSKSRPVVVSPSMFNFSANHLFLLSRMEYRSCVVFVMKDDSTHRVYRLYDFTKSPVITPGQCYCVSGKVNSVDQLYLVIESVKADRKHRRSSNVLVPADGAGGSPMR